MSPEQAQGSPNLDERADVWSLAVIAYECLSGKLPFCGPNGPSTLLQILTQPPPPLGSWLAPSDPRCAAEVDAALAGGLAKNPAERTASAGAFVERLAAALGSSVRGSPGPALAASLGRPEQLQPATSMRSAPKPAPPLAPRARPGPFADRPAHVLWPVAVALVVLLVVLGLIMA
jgi:serine/threonine-protein kinase